ncbi:hypothetical protein [Pseudomonas sp. 5P_3.1_Bac2]|uniref:DUF7079 family protein n=1 Tax=Pseudomonas sp. 5P_3.1_Bac2 TaxID=2971617 RepID=UPI0021C7760A|nr:hypothetical protein [Pseudomonas sp. 5P_3.1_Bac2]MCU1716799.1 hypothetical protein [Pseudomonas sp. 5P_3.1_Bac2]
MGRVLTPQDRAKIQIALAEAFVDSAVDYQEIAEQVRDYDPKVVQDILYEDVAPVCFSNLETPVPPIWTGFDNQWLLSAIAIQTQAREASWVKRQLHKLLVAWLRYSYGYIWKEIAAFRDSR